MTPNIQIIRGEAIPANHLVRLVVDQVAQLDLSARYWRYGVRGGRQIARLANLKSELFLDEDLVDHIFPASKNFGTHLVKEAGRTTGTKKVYNI